MQVRWLIEMPTFKTTHLMIWLFEYVAAYAQRVVKQAGAHGHGSIVLLYARSTASMLAFQASEDGSSVRYAY